MATSILRRTERLLPLLFCRPCGGTGAFKVGDSVETCSKLSREVVDTFSQLTGDHNPVHAGPEGLVHGALLNGLVSAVIGTRLPGPGTLVVSQNLRFPHKCYVDDVVTVRVQLVEARKLLRVRYAVTASDRTVLEGDAKLLYKPNKAVVA